MTDKTRKNRFQDIAVHAKVSTATVDRVLNERGGVSQKTVLKVLSSAKALGTKRILPSATRRPLIVEAVLSRSSSAYYDRLNKALQQVVKLIDLQVTIYRTHIDVGHPLKLAKYLKEISANRDGIILFAGDFPEVAEAINTVVNKTVVITISTDITNCDRHCYVGIDNFKAGKSAAKISEAMCRKGGKVLVITPEYLAKSQVERFKGFSQFFAEVGFSNKLVFFQRERKPNVDLENLFMTLEANSDTRVLYSPINDKFLELVIETGRHDEAIRSLAKIVHDLSSHSVECLATGLIDIVLDSNPLQQVFKAIEFIASHHGHTATLSASAVDFQLYTLENLPAREIFTEV